MIKIAFSELSKLLIYIPRLEQEEHIFLIEIKELFKMSKRFLMNMKNYKIIKSKIFKILFIEMKSKNLTNLNKSKLKNLYGFIYKYTNLK